MQNEGRNHFAKFTTALHVSQAKRDDLTAQKVADRIWIFTFNKCPDDSQGRQAKVLTRRSWMAHVQEGIKQEWKSCLKHQRPCYFI
mmetsp:Transcript_8470/g.19530  ORF Transcript_8470/g.19530 Transcript_8470/m.19530 type:complete len:86 (+) Transcript_8470:420-677(+)